MGFNLAFKGLMNISGYVMLVLFCDCGVVLLVMVTGLYVGSNYVNVFL
jgi:hypothetical protein